MKKLIELIHVENLHRYKESNAGISRLNEALMMLLPWQ